MTRIHIMHQYLAKDAIKAQVCSAALKVFPPGVLKLSICYITEE